MSSGPQTVAARRLALEVAVAGDQLALTAAVGRLRHTVRRRADVAARIRARPMAWLLGAVALGVILGARRR